MPYTYILDDSIKSPSLILTADHSTLLFLPGFFYKIKNFFFHLWVNLYMITDTYLHDPPPFNGPFSMTPPFSAVSKSCDPSSVSTPFPYCYFLTSPSGNRIQLPISCHWSRWSLYYWLICVSLQTTTTQICRSEKNGKKLSTILTKTLNVTGSSKSWERDHESSRPNEIRMLLAWSCLARTFL